MLGTLSAPLAAVARQARVSRIGYLGPSTPALEHHLMDAFQQRLHDLGHTESQNFVIVYRWADAHDDRLHALAAELVRLNPGGLPLQQPTTFERF